jgi:hypothetical protein
VDWFKTARPEFAFGPDLQVLPRPGPESAAAGTDPIATRADWHGPC